MTDEIDVKAEKEKRAEGRRKAATFLLSLDSDTAAEVMKGLDEVEMAMVSEEMTRMGEVSGEQMDEVLNEYHDSSGSDFVAASSMLEQILTKALGKARAKEMLGQIKRQSRDSKPFRSLQSLNASQMQKLLHGEHPQVLAMVIGHLEPEVSIGLLHDLDPEERYEVIKRLARTEELPVDLVRQVDQILEARAFSLSMQGADRATERRFQTIAQVLNFAEPSMSKTIIDQLNKEMPAAAAEIQALMFVFEDLLNIEDRQVQKILGEVEKSDLALALKTADKEVSDKLLGNMSQRARDNMLEELNMLGPQPLSEVEAAQKRILDVVKDMEQRGDITINRGGGEVMV